MSKEKVKKGTVVEYNDRPYKVLEDRKSKLLIAPVEGAGARELVEKSVLFPEGEVGIDVAGAEGDRTVEPPKKEASDDDKKPPAEGKKAEDDGAKKEAPKKAPKKAAGGKAKGGKK